MLRPALLSCRRCETGGMGDNSDNAWECPGVCNKRTETCPSTWWADSGGGSCTDTPRGEPVGAAWDLTESVGLMREASRRGFARDRVLERSARRVPTRRSVALCPTTSRQWVGEASGGVPLDINSGRNARECAGTSLVPAIIHENESLPLCPLLGGGAAKGGENLVDFWGRCLGEKKKRKEEGGIPGGFGTEGRDIPMAVKRGNRSEPWNCDPRYTLTPD